MLLTVIIPCFNEENTIIKILEKINKQKNYLNIEIVVSDDGSTDGTINLLKKNKNLYDKLVDGKINKGKGAAIKNSLEYINGDIVLIQDADLEYDPQDYKNLVHPILNNETEVVYGSRVLKNGRYKNKQFTSLFRIFCNHILTEVSNFINNQKLTDAHTCYKVFNSRVLKMVKLEQNDFSFCPEINTKLSNLNIDIKEVPISYKGRTYKDGKKIKFIDGVIAIITIIKYKFFQ